MNLNAAQMIFTLFLAIFWSTVAGAWPRWKPFHWPVVFTHARPRLRLIAAFLFLNLAPALTAGVILWLLAPFDQIGNPAQIVKWLWVTLAGVVPAFSIFGFSRTWVGLIALKPDWFYLKRSQLEEIGLPANSPDEEVEPSQETLKLDRSTSIAIADIIVGVSYVIGSVLFAWVGGTLAICIK